MNVLAIDPGKSGAVALLGLAPLLEVRRDFKTLQELSAAIMELGPRADVAVIELVHAMPGQGVTSMFNFGEARGVALGALNASVQKYCPLIEVTPQRWQGYYWNWLEPTKDRHKDFDSREVCAFFLPRSQPFLLRKKDHNTADAILMALWYQMNPGAPSAVHRKKTRKSKLTKRTPAA